MSFGHLFFCLYLTSIKISGMKKFFIILVQLCAMSVFGQVWQAPPEYAQLDNPLPYNEATLRQGEKIFKRLCASCHGESGRGDVPSMQSLRPKPSDLTSVQVQNQTDGALFWKISEGKGLMASYKHMLSEEERWALVHYIRFLAKNNKRSEEIKSGAETEAFTGQVEQKQNNRGGATRSDKKTFAEAFPFTVLINAKTTHIIHPETFGLVIQHRFGYTFFDRSALTQFLGLDLAANMRFAFEIPFNERLMFEIGRTRYGKYYDLGVKYLLLRQTTDNSMPFSLALYENIAVTSDQAPAYSEDAVFDNGTPFTYKFYHRLSYDNQIIVSRKFNERLSGQVTFQLIWRNLMPYSEKPRFRNVVVAIPLAFRYRLGYMQAISFEIMPNNQPKNMPVALAYEVASSGNHVFQITYTNSDRFTGQNLFTVSTYNPHKGFILGFNLIRYF